MHAHSPHPQCSNFTVPRGAWPNEVQFMNSVSLISFAVAIVVTSRTAAHLYCLPAKEMKEKIINTVFSVLSLYGFAAFVDISIFIELISFI